MKQRQSKDAGQAAPEAVAQEDEALKAKEQAAAAAAKASEEAAAAAAEAAEAEAAKIQAAKEEEAAAAAAEAEAEAARIKAEEEEAARIEAEEEAARIKAEEEEAKKLEEERLTDKVGLEVAQTSKRRQEMTDLSASLQQSISRRAEAESMLSQEIGGIRNKLVEEAQAEEERSTELMQLLKDFDSSIKEKEGLISSEQKLLEQMQELKEQVKEESIKTQFAASMSTKADLISIEVILLEDLLDCREQLEEELSRTKARAGRIKDVASALPSPEDKDASRSYNWEDVGELEEVLLDSIQGMQASCDQVEKLRSKFEDAVRQKRQVLGLPLLNAYDAEVVSGLSTDAEVPQLSLKDIQVLTNEELKGVAAQATKKAAGSVGKSITIAAGGFGEFLKSPDAQALAGSAIDLVESTKEYFTSLGSTISSAKEAYESKALKGEEMTTFDKIFLSVKQGVKGVKESDEVQDNVSKWKAAGKAIPSATGQLTKLTGQALKGAAADDELGSTVKDALAAVQSALVALVGLGAKSITQASSGRLLTGSGGVPPPPVEQASEPEGSKDVREEGATEVVE
ncbi:unnamed protein product [Chrysoparadoxa australica]